MSHDQHYNDHQTYTPRRSDSYALKGKTMHRGVITPAGAGANLAPFLSLQQEPLLMLVLQCRAAAPQTADPQNRNLWSGRIYCPQKHLNASTPMTLHLHVYSVLMLASQDLAGCRCCTVACSLQLTQIWALFQHVCNGSNIQLLA